MPVVLDGFIAGSAALVAEKLCLPARDYLIAGHVSVERGHWVLLDALGLALLLDLDLRLGEGTGAALAIGIIEGASAAHRQMATFAEAASASGKTETPTRSLTLQSEILPTSLSDDIAGCYTARAARRCNVAVWPGSRSAGRNAAC